MCGRYASGSSVDELVEEFDVEQVLPGVPGPSWNVAPTDVVRAVVERRAAQGASGVRSLVPMRWGLVPFWAEGTAGAARLINARGETAADKPSFRAAYRRRRCLLPADGYYEWQKLGQRKQPWFIHRQDNRQLAMAGLWETWVDRELPEDHPDRFVVTCTILTTAATDALGHVHDRMPMTVRSDAWAAWLDRDLQDPEEIAGLLVPDPGQDITSHPVAAAVGKVSNNFPGLVDPVALPGE
ncbi:Putative SOS response-associated peptidase YedK [Raineyella antarctica]|uniref:Abasic site processing protein n=1 Tax=Raineyella antarctica TaxID=1577474 RepID=A0A1G6GUR0_9ACTN|nr:SOS response-associated peptidase [Raineyella antarctica]SDB85770.1 Putative SOS response-associated peptidase YedK [Raineyella antarctica]